MKLKVTTAFNDMTIEDADTRRREIGTEFETDDTRGVALIALGLVEIAAPATPPSSASTVPLSLGTKQAPGANVTEPLPPV